MNYFVIALALLTSFPALAANYECVASRESSLHSVALVPTAEDRSITAAAIGSARFTAIQTDADTLVLSISNQASPDQVAYATTFVPKEKGKPSRVALSLAGRELASLDCRLK